MDQGREMNKEIASRWTAALRSGEYKQGYGTLSRDNEFCCLGVLCDLAVKEGVTELTNWETIDGALVYDQETAVLPFSVRKWAEIDQAQGVFSGAEQINGAALSELNDSGKFSFNKIADLIDYFADCL